MVADFELYKMKEHNVKFTPHLSIKGEKHIKCMFGTSNPRLLDVAIPNHQTTCYVLTIHIIICIIAITLGAD